jgi:hypothetical protein
MSPIVSVICPDPDSAVRKRTVADLKDAGRVDQMRILRVNVWHSNCTVDWQRRAH